MERIGPTTLAHAASRSSTRVRPIRAASSASGAVTRTTTYCSPLIDPTSYGGRGEPVQYRIVVERTRERRRRGRVRDSAAARHPPANGKQRATPARDPRRRREDAGRGERPREGVRGGGGRVAAAHEVVERVREPAAGVGGPVDQHPRDPGDVLRTEVAVGGQHGGGLEVVERGHDPRPEEPEHRRRGAPLEIDEDADDDVASDRASGEHENLVDEARIDAYPSQDRGEPLQAEAPRDHVGVERVDERVGLPVVPEEKLAGVGGGVETAAEQLGQLESDVLAQVAELPATEVRQLVLEDDGIVRDAVERELLPDRVPDLGRARGHEDDARLASATLARRLQHLDQLGDPRHVDLVLGLLERRAEERAQRVELAAEIRLVEVPATEERRPGGGRGALAAKPHRVVASVSAISAGTRSRTALAATFTALPIARAVERPWHLISRCSKPRIGAPPYWV